MTHAAWLYLARILPLSSAVYAYGVEPPGLFDKLGISPNQPLATRAGNYRGRFVVFVPFIAWLLPLDKKQAQELERFVLKRLGEAGLRAGSRAYPLQKNGKSGPNASETVISDISQSLPAIRRALSDAGHGAATEITLSDVRVWLPPEIAINERWRDFVGPLPMSM